MNGYSEFKKKIEHRAEILEETARELEALGMDGSRWRGYLRGVHDSLEEPLLKIAVVGSVKSGKSTLINSMIGEDLLKRGAGIVTAFITRVVTDAGEGGWVEFKPWGQIGSEVNASLRMLPVFAESESGSKEFDIRNREDREQIAFLLGRMKSEWLQGRGKIDPHFMFLERCVEGFDLVEAEIGEEINRTAFDGAALSKHQLYAGEERRSVYVRDIELHHPVSWLGERIELADCQGSDSPNPAHFELLQQYLLSCHFIVYLVGSRTGLREADFKLLDLIKSLKMFPQTLFVLNLDLDVHEDRDGLEKITERVRSELGWLAPQPRLYAFSALFRLLRQLGDKAPKFERRRFKAWKDAKPLAGVSEAGWDSFRGELEERIRVRRSRVLIGCGLSRLAMIAANINDTARVRQSALESNTAETLEKIEKLRSRHSALQSTLQSLADTVAGLRQSIKSEVDSRVFDYFNPEKGAIVREALDLVAHYPAELDRREDFRDHARFIRAYYGFYLEFRQNLSRHLIEKVNLRIVDFAKDEEFALKQRIQKSSEALWSFFDAALADYRRELLGTAPEQAPMRRPLPGAETPGRAVPPCFSSFLQRNGLGRGILFIKFGITSLPNILAGIKAMFQNCARDEQGLRAMFQRAREMALDEARSELLRAFHDFSQTLRSGFLYPTVDQGCLTLLEEFRARAEMAHVDFTNLLDHNSMEGQQRNSAMETLTRARRITAAMMEDLEGIRRAAEEREG